MNHSGETKKFFIRGIHFIRELELFPASKFALSCNPAYSGTVITGLLYIYKPNGILSSVPFLPQNSAGEKARFFYIL